ncbi:DUF2806 domain-containing protein [Bosea sp. LjRoot9]|uniref:DUF2806 domain-containing protein n=1 Tax=Bosea sp. LjRoot9 TaxID=3342341 RepID=UPI003ECDEBB3
MLAQPVSMEARLTESGVKISIKSRLVSAWDRLRGSTIDAAAAEHEGRATLQRAKDAVQADLIAEAGKTIAKEVKTDPKLAIAILSGDFAEASRRYQNRTAIAGMTGEEVIQITATRPETKMEEEDSSTEIDDDWMNQFYNYAGDASSEVLQRSFARVLAGEIVNPGSFSKRTLRSLCELDKDTAAAFQKLARYRDRLHRHISKPTGEDELPYHIIVALDDAGLIANVPGVGFDLHADESNVSILQNGTRSIVCHQKIKTSAFQPPLRIDVYALTRFGSDICSILPDEDDNFYLHAVTKQLMEDENVGKIFIGDVTAMNKTTGEIQVGNQYLMFESVGKNPN